MSLDKLRNIGISAHIDSGKTTLSERILLLLRSNSQDRRRSWWWRWRDDGPHGTGKRAWDHDHQCCHQCRVERSPDQLDRHPGHVDFTVEVERSLRVLDGAVLVLCSVGGVQSQSITVDRQMKRYQCPRVAFINKMDRTGANPFRVAEQLREKLNADAFLMQYPIGHEESFSGVVRFDRNESLHPRWCRG